MNRGLVKLGIVGLLVGTTLWFFFKSSSNDKAISTIDPRPASSAAISIIAFGDSLTAGYGLPVSEAYPAQLQVALKDLGYDVLVINSGVSGETTRGNLERAKFIREQNPDIVILGIGGNDALRLLPLDETRKNLLATIDILQSGQTAPVVILLKMQAPLNAGLASKREFDALYEEIATEKKLILVPFLTAELFLDPKNKLSDGIHYNALGYKKVVDTHLVPTITKVLDKLTKN